MKYAAFVVLVCFAWYFLTRTSRQKRKQEEFSARKRQVLSLFTKEDKLLGQEVLMRLEGRTGNRRSAWDTSIYRVLNSLVADGELVTEMKEVVLSGFTVKKTTYSLPKSNNEKTA